MYIFLGVVLLSNYALHRRITDLCSSTSNNSSKSYNKKADIYSFGIFLLSLLQGEKIEGDEANIPSTIPSELHDFLSKCLAKQEKRSTTTSQLLNHSFICQVVPSPKHRIDPNTPERNISPDFIIPQRRLTQHGHTRIEDEFEILTNLGKGAFGDVVKVSCI